MPKRYWLMKSEPGAYSIDDLARDGRTHWDGVRNYQARNFMRDQMEVGDGVLFYHSNAEPPGVAGVAEVVRSGYPDPSALDPKSRYFDPKASEADPRWYMVDIEFREKFRTFVPLERLRTEPGLDAILVTTKSRLSVQPVTEAEFEIVCRMGRGGSGGD
jgi:predicted RNA-binding protein with PUA-like domain